MVNSEEEKYLGDIVCHNGMNRTNIEARKEKGFGIKNQIMDMLHDVCFGPFQFEVAMIWRESLFLSSTLLNSEAWVGLSVAEIEQLEHVDESLLRNILEVGHGCPKEMLYLYSIDVYHHDEKNYVSSIHFTRTIFFLDKPSSQGPIKIPI